MPIIFSKGIVEKIIEKIVEKIVYIAVGAALSIRMRIYMIIKPILPPVTVVAHHIFIVSKFVYSFMPRLPKLLYKVIINPIKPSRVSVGLSSASHRISGVKAPAMRMLGRLTISITKPYMVIVGRIMLLYYGSFATRHGGIRPLYRVFSNPPPPSRINIGTWSLSIGVRKTP